MSQDTGTSLDGNDMAEQAIAALAHRLAKEAESSAILSSAPSTPVTTESTTQMVVTRSDRSRSHHNITTNIHQLQIHAEDDDRTNSKFQFGTEKENIHPFIYKGLPVIISTGVTIPISENRNQPRCKNALMVVLNVSSLQTPGITQKIYQEGMPAAFVIYLENNTDFMSAMYLDNISGNKDERRIAEALTDIMNLLTSEMNPGTHLKGGWSPVYMELNADGKLGDMSQRSESMWSLYRVNNLFTPTRLINRWFEWASQNSSSEVHNPMTNIVTGVMEQIAFVTYTSDQQNLGYIVKEEVTTGGKNRLSYPVDNSRRVGAQIRNNSARQMDNQSNPTIFGMTSDEIKNIKQHGSSNNRTTAKLLERPTRHVQTSMMNNSRETDEEESTDFLIPADESRVEFNNFNELPHGTSRKSTHQNTQVFNGAIQRVVTKSIDMFDELVGIFVTKKNSKTVTDNTSMEPTQEEYETMDEYDLVISKVLPDSDKAQKLINAFVKKHNEHMFLIPNTESARRAFVVSSGSDDSSNSGTSHPFNSGLTGFTPAYHKYLTVMSSLSRDMILTCPQALLRAVFEPIHEKNGVIDIAQRPEHPTLDYLDSRIHAFCENAKNEDGVIPDGVLVSASVALASLEYFRRKIKLGLTSTGTNNKTHDSNTIEISPSEIFLLWTIFRCTAGKEIDLDVYKDRQRQREDGGSILEAGKEPGFFTDRYTPSGSLSSIDAMFGSLARCFIVAAIIPISEPIWISSGSAVVENNGSGKKRQLPDLQPFYLEKSNAREYITEFQDGNQPLPYNQAVDLWKMMKRSAYVFEPPSIGATTFVRIFPVMLGMTHESCPNGFRQWGYEASNLLGGTMKSAYLFSEQALEYINSSPKDIHNNNLRRFIGSLQNELRGASGTKSKNITEKTTSRSNNSSSSSRKRKSTDDATSDIIVPPLKTDAAFILHTEVPPNKQNDTCKSIYTLAPLGTGFTRPFLNLTVAEAGASAHFVNVCRKFHKDMETKMMKDVGLSVDKRNGKIRSKSSQSEGSRPRPPTKSPGGRKVLVSRKRVPTVKGRQYDDETEDVEEDRYSSSAEDEEVEERPRKKRRTSSSASINGHKKRSAPTKGMSRGGYRSTQVYVEEEEDDYITE